MTFDPVKVPGGDVARWGEECRAKALAALDAEDWRPVYDWTKSWIGWGGGAWIPDTWLLYAVSALLQGKPRIAVHSLDLGLGFWLAGEADRAALTWCRGAIVMDRLADPKTALLDLEGCHDLLPQWLSPRATERLEMCRDEATKSRKRVPSVKPRPLFTGFDHMLDAVAPAVVQRRDGEQPEIWKRVAPYFA
jgi:hypothetical protein